MNLDSPLAPAKLQPPPDVSTLSSQEAEQELALQHQFTPPCKNQRFPQGAVQRPRNRPYLANLTIPDPYTTTNSLDQYDQQKINAFYQKENFSISSDLLSGLSVILIMVLLYLLS
jgi:hypothetical protein